MFGNDTNIGQAFSQRYRGKNEPLLCPAGNVRVKKKRFHPSIFYKRKCFSSVNSKRGKEIEPQPKPTTSLLITEPETKIGMEPKFT